MACERRSSESSESHCALMQLGWPHQRAAGPPSAESFQPAGWRADVLLPCDDMLLHAMLWPGGHLPLPTPLLSFSFILPAPQLLLWPVTVAATFRLGHCPPGRPAVCRFGIVRHVPGGNLKLAGCPSPSRPQIRESEAGS
jgi:hypothetical protein